MISSKKHYYCLRRGGGLVKFLSVAGFGGAVGFAMASLTATIGGLSISTVAFADAPGQDVPTSGVPESNDSSPGLQEIVVQAQRRSETQHDVPISVTAVTEERLTQLNINDLPALTQATPGLNSTMGINYQFTYIRGVGSAFQQPGREPAVATYIDGAYVERGYGTDFEILDSASVETLRGPQGTLWGRNATGGAILINTADPTFSTTGSTMAEIGNLDHELIQGVFNTPINDVLAARVAVRYRDDGGWVRNQPDGYMFGANNDWTVRGKLAFVPGPAFSAIFEYQYDSAKRTQGANSEFLPAVYCSLCSQSAFTLPVTNPYTSVTNVLNGGYGGADRGNFTNLRMKYDAGPISLSSTTAYREMTDFAVFDGDYTELPGFNIAQWSGSHTFTQDVTAASSFHGMLNGIAGVSYLNDTSQIAEDFYSTDTTPGGAPSVSNRVGTRSLSGFAEGTLEPLPGLKVSGGARWTEDRRYIFDTHATFISTTPRAVVSYDTGPTNIYASYNKGFKSGGYSVPASTALIFEPESIESYEIGAKYASSDRRLHVNLSVFHYLYTNIQTNTVDQTDPNAISRVQNANGLGTGGELEINWLPIDALNLYSGVSNVNAHYTRYASAGVQVPVYNGAGQPIGMEPGTEDLSGQRLPQAAKWTAFVGSTLTEHFTDNWKWQLNAFVRYSSSYDFMPGGGGPLRTDMQPSYVTAKLSGMIMPDDEHFNVGFYIDNLTDKVYYDFRFTTAPFGGLQYVAKPRTFGLRAQYKF